MIAFLHILQDNLSGSRNGVLNIKAEQRFNTLEVILQNNNYGWDIYTDCF
jgi:hypothetical protein